MSHLRRHLRRQLWRRRPWRLSLWSLFWDEALLLVDLLDLVVDRDVRAGSTRCSLCSSTVTIPSVLRTLRLTSLDIGNNDYEDG